MSFLQIDEHCEANAIAPIKTGSRSNFIQGRDQLDLFLKCATRVFAYPA